MQFINEKGGLRSRNPPFFIDRFSAFVIYVAILIIVNAIIYRNSDSKPVTVSKPPPDNKNSKPAMFTMTVK